MISSICDIQIQISSSRIVPIKLYSNELSRITDVSFKKAISSIQFHCQIQFYC